MGEQDIYYSVGGDKPGDINPQIASQLAGYVAPEKGSHVDVPENPAGGTAPESAAPVPIQTENQAGPVPMAPEERQQRVEELKDMAKLSTETRKEIQKNQNVISETEKIESGPAPTSNPGITNEQSKDEISEQTPKESTGDVETVVEEHPEDILKRAIDEGHIYKDAKDRWAAKDKIGEDILFGSRADQKATAGEPEPERKYTITTPKPEGEKPEEPVFERKEEPSKEPEVIIPEEAKDDTPEKITERQQLIESRARENKVFQAIETKKAAYEAVQNPPHKGFLSCCYLRIMRPAELNRYRNEQEAYRNAQSELIVMDNLRRIWLKKETQLQNDAEELTPEITKITARVNTGEATKKEQIELQKALGKLVGQREAIDFVFAQEIAERVGASGYQPAKGSEFKGIDCRPLSEKEKEKKTRFDFVESEEKHRKQIVTDLQTELVPPEAEEHQPTAEKPTLGERFGLTRPELRTFRDLSPEAQERFFKEEASGSLAKLAAAKAYREGIQLRINEIITGKDTAQGPMEMFQLYTALRATNLAERQAEFQIKHAIDRVSKGESLNELKNEIIKRTKQAIGEKVFYVDTGLEIKADTKLSELVLAGNSDLADAIYNGWRGINAIKILGERTAFGAVNLRRAFNQRFAELIPESINATRREAELSQTLSQIGANIVESKEAATSITEIRKASQKRRQKIIEEALVEAKQMAAEQKHQAVENIVSGMIELLEIPPQSKKKLKRIYQEEQLSDSFLDNLSEYYQKSLLRLEKKRAKTQEEYDQLEKEKAYFTDLLQKILEGTVFIAAEDVEKELMNIEDKINEKGLAIQDRIEIIAQGIKEKLQQLEGQIDAEMYRIIMTKIV